MPPPMSSISRLEGDPRAQRLSAALNAANQLLGKVFFTPTRRSWIMSLPTDSGEQARGKLARYYHHYFYFDYYYCYYYYYYPCYCYYYYDYYDDYY